MKSTRRSVTMALLAALIAGVPLGFASWAINGIAARAFVNVSVDDDAQLFSGISLSEPALSKCETFFFLDEQNATTNIGKITYSIEVQPEALNETLKNENNRGGYSFVVAAALSSSISLFAQAEGVYLYFSGVTIGDAAISIIETADKTISFSIPFATDSKTVSQLFKLSFAFSNALLVDYASEILSGVDFVLSLTGAEQ